MRAAHKADWLQPIPYQRLALTLLHVHCPCPNLQVMSCLAADGHISTSTSANTQPQAHIVSGTVIVTYRRLPKATYVRLQPLEHGFHEQVCRG